jgi:hypothetical protein
VRRRVEHTVDRARLDNGAAVQDVHAVDDLAHDREVVRDEQVAEPELVAKRVEQVEDLRLDRDVEGRDRLVADEELRLQRERAGNGDALAFSTRECDGLRCAYPGGRPTRASRSTTETPGSGPTARASRSVAPTVRTGFSDEYGSWKIICTSRRSCRRAAVSRRA